MPSLAGTSDPVGASERRIKRANGYACARVRLSAMAADATRPRITDPEALEFDALKYFCGFVKA